LLRYRKRYQRTTREINKGGIKNLQEETDALREEIKIREKTIQDFENYKEKYQALKHDIHAFDVNMQSNIERVNAVLESLTRALMSRKKMVEA